VTTLDEYFDFVRRLGSGGINRSENDVSSQLKEALEAFGLHGVIDTASGDDRAKRPDIALYVDATAADVASAADIVVESKKPAQLAAFSSLLEALIDEALWLDKFVPYVRAHSVRLSYFVLTTFERMLIVPISTTLRSNIYVADQFDEARRREALNDSFEFDLRVPTSAAAFSQWCDTHIRPGVLSPPALSTIVDIGKPSNTEALEAFAGALADVVVGLEGRPTPGGALISTVRVPHSNLADLDPLIRQSIVIYAMAAHGGMTIDSANAYLTEHLESELSDFISASVHSFVGRLFAVKAIEDGFCIDTNPPLIPQALWIFHTDRFDDVPADELPARFFAALNDLAIIENPAIRDLAATGRFYDWLSLQVDPAAFRRLIELFFAHNFLDIDGDLLGRFFELYAQRVDRRRRKQLGQYYTPLPIVRCMWRLSTAIAQERGVIQDIVVLDPGVGSGSFLIEGASTLAEIGLQRFWNRLTGFDISPQAIGIAQVNLYLAILAHLDREQAEEVGTLQLYPTDALDPRNGARLRNILPLLTSETTRAFLQSRITLSEQVKQHSRFHLVIGNPPYKNNSNQTLAQVAERFPRLLRSSRDNARARV
jgi:hypothetical protein